MDTSYNTVSIDRDELQSLLVRMQRAERFCRKARPASAKPSKEELMSEPTCFYSGASGYAGATLQHVIQALESHMPPE